MATINGTAGDDRLNGTANADTIYGRGGNDTIGAKSGNDAVYGGAGNDQLLGELGNDRLFGEDGNDTLTGGLGNDRMIGGAGGDRLFDTANGVDGNDFFDGGAGGDLLSFEGNTVGVTLTLGANGAESRTRQGAEVDLVRNVENVEGSSGADRIAGNNLANRITGNGGNDQLAGGGGNDVLSVRDNGSESTTVVEGGSGNDTITGGLGTNRLLGGTGADTVNAGRDSFVLGPDDVDTADLGVDGARDLYAARIDLSGGSAESEVGFGVDRVRNFGAQDVLDVRFSGIDGGVESGREVLDSDGNGVVNDADAAASRVGQDLVLDFGVAFVGSSTGFDDDQRIILENVASISVDQLL